MLPLGASAGCGGFTDILQAANRVTIAGTVIAGGLKAGQLVGAATSAALQKTQPRRYRRTDRWILECGSRAYGFGMATFSSKQCVVCIPRAVV